MIGVALDTIRAIENDRIGLSDEMAIKISKATGCDADTLRKLRTIFVHEETTWTDPATGITMPLEMYSETDQAAVFDQMGKPYTEESFKQWMELQQSDGVGWKNHSAHILEELSLRLAAFLEAARQAGKEANAQDYIWKALDRALETFDLRDLASQLLKEAGDWRRSDWREIVPPGRQALYLNNQGKVVFLTPEEARSTKVMLEYLREQQALALPLPPLPTSPAAESPNIEGPPPASPARGSAGKASSSPRARAARKSRPRS